MPDFHVPIWSGARQSKARDKDEEKCENREPRRKCGRRRSPTKIRRYIHQDRPIQRRSAVRYGPTPHPSRVGGKASEKRDRFAPFQGVPPAMTKLQPRASDQLRQGYSSHSQRFPYYSGIWQRRRPCTLNWRPKMDIVLQRVPRGSWLLIFGQMRKRWHGGGGSRQ